jgi:subtilisin family serine protease
LIGQKEKPYDDNGHGTFTCGCIASTGHLSSGMYQGIAPDANLCIIKAFDTAGYGLMSDIIKGIDILLSIKDKYNIRILCLPFEFPYLKSLKINPLEDIIKSASASNMAIIVPSGNLGYQPYSIYFPGNMKEAITVGGAYCVENNLENFRVCSFSGRGPTIKEIAKPDILAPAVNITSLAANTSYIPGLKIKSELKVPYSTMSGTSIACALIAGVCAVVLEKTPELSPPDLKSVLCLSTMSLGENKLSQGSGLFIFDKIMK